MSVPSNRAERRRSGRLRRTTVLAGSGMLLSTGLFGAYVGNPRLPRAYAYVIARCTASDQTSLLSCISSVASGAADEIYLSANITLRANLPALTVATPNDIFIRAASSSTILDLNGNLGLQISDATHTVTVSNLTIENGNSGGLTPSDDRAGGAIGVTAGDLYVDTVQFLDNTAGGHYGNHPRGGAIYAHGNLHVLNSVLSGNTAEEGGAIYAYGASTVEASFISGNYATPLDPTGGGQGGGIRAFGTLTVTTSTILNNKATGPGGSGGGIFDLGKTYITNSTISGNAATVQGGGMTLDTYYHLTQTISFSTIVHNKTDGYGSNLWVSGYSAPATLTGTVIGYPAWLTPAAGQPDNCARVVDTSTSTYSIVTNATGTDVSCGADTSQHLHLASDTSLHLSKLGETYTPSVGTPTSVLVNYAPFGLDPAVSDDQNGTTRKGRWTVGSIQRNFHYPTLASVTPGSGSTSGGTSVTLTGTYLTSVSAVTFAAVPATSFTIVNATQVTAITPAHAASGPDIVRVETNGAGRLFLPNAFTWTSMPGPAAPTIGGVSPSTGSTAGGTSVTITGTYLTGATAVSFGGNPATSFTVDSATQITAFTPAGTTGAVNVSVATAGGTATSVGAFTYTAAPSPSPSPSPSGGGGGGATAPAPAPSPSAPSGPPAPVPLSGTLAAGGSSLLVNGLPQNVVVAPDAPGTGLTISGSGFTLRLQGLGPDGTPLPLGPGGILQIQADRTVTTSGTGFQPGSQASLFLDPPATGGAARAAVVLPRSGTLTLGTLPVNSGGNFAGTVPLPGGISSGVHVLQVVGRTTDGATRAVSLAIQVTDQPKSPTARRARARVYFPALSASLTPQAKSTLRALVERTGRSALAVSCTGFVQPSTVTANDRQLSDERARAVAAYLRVLGVTGAYVAHGNGRDGTMGPQARRVDVSISYAKP